MDLSIPSRFLVFMPYGDQIGISQKIEDDAERARLKQLVSDLHQASANELGGGFIVRTVAEGVGEDELRRDMEFLLKLWRHVRARVQVTEGPALISEELPLSLRILRDQVGAHVAKVWLIRAKLTCVHSSSHKSLCRRRKPYWSITQVNDHYLICITLRMICKKHCSKKSCLSQVVTSLSIKPRQ